MQTAIDKMRDCVIIAHFYLLPFLESFSIE